MPNAIASILLACRRCIALSIILCPQTGLAWTASADIQLAAKYCANDPSPLRLSEDGMILCFDGLIDQHVPIDRIQKMNDHGFFVVRSPGGYSRIAMKIADILLDKHATVIVHDYCLSACANFLLVATGKTYVLQHSIVAWHRGIMNAQCERLLRDEGMRALVPVDIKCEYLELLTAFFQRRDIENR